MIYASHLQLSARLDDTGKRRPALTELKFYGASETRFDADNAEKTVLELP